MRETPLVYTDIVFNAKPDAVPYNYRISYKVTQLCLIMRICGRGDVCSLIKLHMISFALISQENMRKLVDFADGIGSAPIVRFDPSVNRALTYAIGYGLIKRQQNAKYKLTDRGKQLAEQIKAVGDLIEKGGNHPGIIIFDEPAQQSIVPEDMKSFIETVVEIKKPFQIITAITLNSQELINIINGLDASSHHTIQIEGKAFKAL